MANVTIIYVLQDVSCGQNVIRVLRDGTDTELQGMEQMEQYDGTILGYQFNL